MAIFDPRPLVSAIEVQRKPDQPNILVGRFGVSMHSRIKAYSTDTWDAHLRYVVGFPRHVRTGFMHFIWISVTSEGGAPDSVDFTCQVPKSRLDSPSIDFTVPVKMI